MVMMVRMDRGDAGTFARLAQDLLFAPVSRVRAMSTFGQRLRCLGTSHLKLIRLGGERADTKDRCAPHRFCARSHLSAFRYVG